MKNYILISAFIFTGSLSFGQNPEKLDTIYANDQKNVALFFPGAIGQGITGTKNFVFTYNREKQQYFGLLQAKPGKASNLLVIDTQGFVYSYILQYKKELSRLNYFISQSQSIGKEKPEPDSIQKPKAQKIRLNNKAYYQRFSSYLLRKKQGVSRIKNRNQGIVLSVENIVFNKDLLYFVIHIENKSGLDYDINFLNLKIQTRQRGKKKSAQDLLKEPVFQYKVPAKIRSGKKVEMVYAYPKFSLSKERRVLLVLNESNGGRRVSLKLTHRDINNPN
ncbi:uncharacterized protein DUF4138 [Salegentibacter sp. 24]|uniref:DUF4138 domain-containing protein n=1 Tax=Salegentibacter sp. 24 TaxID=2183986 RepID=UPI00105CB0A6|nr:DUF4138 domain-containing protein [Salegentibacter sp. 24]TDN95004.1 uncharacterized protein DUF4138 [Salegentibacter sp. 24]